MDAFESKESDECEDESKDDQHPEIEEDGFSVAELFHHIRTRDVGHIAGLGSIGYPAYFILGVFLSASKWEESSEN